MLVATHCCLLANQRRAQLLILELIPFISIATGQAACRTRTIWEFSEPFHMQCHGTFVTQTHWLLIVSFTWLLVLPSPHRSSVEMQSHFHFFAGFLIFCFYGKYIFLSFCTRKFSSYTLCRQINNPTIQSGRSAGLILCYVKLSQSFTCVTYSPFLWHLHCTWENTRTQRDGLWGMEKHYLAREYSINFQQAAFIIHNIHLT